MNEKHTPTEEQVLREVERRSKLRQDALKAFQSGSATSAQQTLCEAHGFTGETGTTAQAHNTKREEEAQNNDARAIINNPGYYLKGQ